MSSRIYIKDGELKLTDTGIQDMLETIRLIPEQGLKETIDQLLPPQRDFLTAWAAEQLLLQMDLSDG